MNSAELRKLVQIGYHELTEQYISCTTETNNRKRGELVQVQPSPESLVVLLYDIEVEIKRIGRNGLSRPPVLLFALHSDVCCYFKYSCRIGVEKLEDIMDDYIKCCIGYEIDFVIEDGELRVLPDTESDLGDESCDNYDY